MKLTKTLYGKYKRNKDGGVAIRGIKNLDRIGIQKGDIVGIAYKIENDTFVTVIVEKKYIFPNGQTETILSKEDSIGEWASIHTFNDIEKLEEGEYTFEIRLPDYPNIEPISQKFFIYKANQDTLFPTNHFKADQKSIEEFQNKHGFEFCEDYKQFLIDTNGINFFWWGLPEFDTVKNLPDFYEKLNECINQTEWIEEVTTIYGLQHPEAHYDLERDILHHIPKAFIPYMYPIGIDGGGNALLQIAQGERKRKLLMLDHEISSILNDLLLVENGTFTDVYGEKFEYQFKDFNSATPDELIDACIECGAVAYYDLTFNQAFKNLVEKNTVAYEGLKAHYKI